MKENEKLGKKITNNKIHSIGKMGFAERAKARTFTCLNERNAFDQFYFSVNHFTKENFRVIDERP